jgi:hypothetical protein
MVLVFKNVKVASHKAVTKKQMVKEANNMKRDKNFVRVTICGKRYKWYYKTFAKNVLKAAITVTIGFAFAYIFAHILLKAWDAEWDQRMKAQEEYMQKLYEQRIENGEHPLDAYKAIYGGE